MHLVCSKENLARGIQAVQRAVSARGPLPILTHIKLSADGAGLTLTATDLEVGLEARVPAQVSEEGAIALTAKTLAEIVAKLPNADVELARGASEHELTLRCLRAKFTLRGMPASEFPALPQPGDDQAVSLDAAYLLKGIRQTAFAAAGEDKAVISGLFVQLQDGHLELVATDGYRLAWRKTPVETGAGELSVVVPKRAMDELARQLGGNEGGAIRVAVGHNQIAFLLGDRYMTSRLVDGQFPPYKQIIPTAFAAEAQVDRASFLAAVERVSIMASEREANIIKLEFGGDELRLSAANAGLGDSDEVLAIGYSGDPVAITFNSQFLVDALKNMDVETVRVGLNSPLSPVLVRPLEDDNHTSLLMPVNRT